MIKIAPSILSADFANLERDIRLIGDKGADYVHVDVMDGMFVPNITIGIPVTASLRKVTTLPLDVHLMIVNPLRYVEAFCKAGADIVNIHLEAEPKEDILESIRRVKALGGKAGLTIKPGTPAEELLPYIPLIDLALVMTVEPGFGGQSFMEDMMPKLRLLRREIERVNPSCELEVDGGVNAKTARVCVDAGADVLVAGSAVFGAKDVGAAIAAIRG